MRKQRRKQTDRVPARTAELTVTGLGAQGDGLAMDGDTPWFIPFTLPGDRVRVRATAKRGRGWSGEVDAVRDREREPAPDACPHFKVCGGCALQHLGAEAEADFKRHRIIDTLERRDAVKSGEADGLVGTTVTSADHTRRRADFAARKVGDRVLLGFQRRGSRDLVDLRDCAVLMPEITELTAKLREILAGVLAPGARGGAHVTATATGIDLVLSLPDAPELNARRALAAFAEQQGLARLSLDLGGGMTEALAARATPMITPGGAEIPLPGRAFLQATTDGEAHLIAHVRRAAQGAKRVIELFSGIGTFSIPLAAAGHKVAAYELSETAVAAARLAAGRAALSMTAEIRDLFENPLAAKELGKTDLVLLDPPRAGAAAQCAELAVHGPARIIYVSCNPDSFARDAATLRAGGYRLTTVTPIDQFRYSPHVELVAEMIRL